MNSFRRRHAFSRLNEKQIYALLVLAYVLIRWPFLSTFGLVTFDGTYYLGQARTVFGGHMTGAFPVGYPLVVKLFQLVLRDYQVAGTAVSFLAGMASVVVLYRLAGRLTRREYAFLAALAWALHPLFIRFSLMTMSESVYVFWVLLGLSMYGGKRWIPFGLAMGMAVITRPEALAIVVLLGIGRIRFPRQAAAIAASFLIVYAVNVAVLSFDQGRLVLLSKSGLLGSGASSWRLRESTVDFAGDETVSKIIAEKNEPAGLGKYYLRRMPCECRTLFRYTWPAVLALAVFALRRRQYLFLVAALAAFFVNPLFTPRCADRFVLPFLPVLYVMAVVCAGTIVTRSHRRVATGLIFLTVIGQPLVNRAALLVPEAPDMTYTKSLGKQFAPRVRPGDVIAGRKPFFAFYAGGVYTEVPAAPYEETMEYLVRQNVRFLELHQATIHNFRPALRPLMYSSAVINGELRFRQVYVDSAGSMVFERTGRDDPLKWTRLTGSRNTVFAPAWSPDGRRIAFRSLAPDSAAGIFLVEPSGGEPRRIAETGWVVDPLSWSPDGSRVVYADRGARSFDLFIVDVESGAVEAVAGTPGNDVSPSWAPGGDKIVFCGDAGGSPEIWEVELDGRTRRRLTGDGNNTHPAFSPRGGRIAWVRPNEGLVVIDPVAREVLRLGTPCRTYMAPSWSPDGRYIAVTADDWGSPDIYLVTADGRNSLLLTKNSNRDVMPSWSPDGGRIALASDRNSDVTGLWIVEGLGPYLERLNTPMKVGVFAPPQAP